MSRPHWQDAPTWAQWLAQDEDGEWNWFEFEPVAVQQRAPEPNFWCSEGGGNYQWARTTPIYEEWNLTLESRPC